MSINYNKFELFHKNKLIAKVTVNKLKVYVENFDQTLLNPFKKWEREIPLNVFVGWIEDRVIPKTRVGVEGYVKGLGFEEWDARQLFNRTHGTMVSDHWWVKFEGEDDMTYEKARDY